MKMKKLPIGVADFKKMIKGNYYYVDKTLFIKEVIDSGDTILLIPRPRRFGKTLNLSMLRYFYDCCPVAWDPDVDETQQSVSIASSGAEVKPCSPGKEQNLKKNWNSSFAEKPLKNPLMKISY